ncbi:hypothetical protein BKH46_00120 [Helicobacter sp. 12S02634-8]|uniref:NAD(P)/FAD-dependent oxidoreductase n=1 Tax=Helicobacter sp. 12S02634-8 TaxID=1476199 RepID=UPI000BA71F0B|nr:NAD(P)/FAD-dependent oxidoreductase [Helicobacter sp. 12S02634-8]PAF48363.1 hypothetical protein BKH46_00120 [Helicobacter sp. 12S02634-8]
MKQLNILLLGAGYGVLSVLKNLDSKTLQQAKFTLINNNPYHYHTILLHEVSAGVKDKSVCYPLKDILPQEIEIITDTVLSIKHNQVITKNATYAYDYLIIGLGFRSDSFGIKGIEEYALNITSYASALHIREHIQKKLEMYLQDKNPQHLQFAICGGGFTGIELSASLAQELHKKAKHYGIDPALFDIACIEAMPHILPMFDTNASQIARQRLESLGVKVWESSKILECLSDGVLIQNGNENKKIPASTIVWSAGVKGSAVIENSPFFQSERSKIKIDSFLHPIQDLPNRDKIFVVGDCGALSDPISQRFYPPTAQLATREGAYLAQALKAILDGKAPTQGFSFSLGDSICSLGKGYAIGTLKGKTIHGLKAYILKRLVENIWNLKIQGLTSLFKKD